MRNRTEAVTNNLPDSEEEEEQLEDSADDWQPEDDEKPKKRKTSAGSAKKAKNGSKGGARGAKKRKKEESEEEESEEIDESEEEDEEVAAAPKKGKGKKKKQEEYDSEEDSGDDQSTPAKKGGSGGKNFPDKQGFLSLYIFRGDLVNGIKANENLCLWRRDGSSLLQKYLRDKNQADCQWSPSMVYSCWEDRRKDEYLEVKVLCKGDLKNSNVTIVDLDNLEDQCIREREQNAKFVSQKPQGQGGQQSANNSQMGNTSQEGLGEGDEGDDGEEE